MVFLMEYILKILPCSNISAYAKVLDNLVNVQLIDYLDNKNIINNSQYGIRKNHSCVLQLLKMKGIIYKQLSKNNYIIVTFFDLKLHSPL